MNEFLKAMAFIVVISLNILIHIVNNEVRYYIGEYIEGKKTLMPIGN
jgi:hypothetical protein